MQPLHLRVQVPFCNRKCTHCDTLTCQYRLGAASAYTQSLVQEVELAGASYADYTVHSVAISGGSPACLGSAGVDSLFLALRKHFRLADNCSISFKMTPGMISTALMDSLRSAHVDVFHLTLATTNEPEHTLLQRPYAFYSSYQAVDMMLKAYQPTGLAIRLMIGIPGQTEKSLRKSLEYSLDMNPAQVILTPLRRSPRTQLFTKTERGQLPAENPEETAALYSMASEYLKASGFDPYTVNHFALQDRAEPAVLHGLSGMEQLGIGLGTASRIDDLWYHNTTDLKEYIDHIEEPERIIKEIAKPSDAMKTARALMLALCTPEGVQANQFPLFNNWLTKAEEAGTIQTKESVSLMTATGIVGQHALFADLINTALAMQSS